MSQPASCGCAQRTPPGTQTDQGLQSQRRRAAECRQQHHHHRYPEAKSRAMASLPSLQPARGRSRTLETPPAAAPRTSCTRRDSSAHSRSPDRQYLANRRMCGSVRVRYRHRARHRRRSCCRVLTSRTPLAALLPMGGTIPTVVPEPARGDSLLHFDSALLGGHGGTGRANVQAVAVVGCCCCCRHWLTRATAVPPTVRVVGGQGSTRTNQQ